MEEGEMLSGWQALNNALRAAQVSDIVAIFGRELEFYTPPPDIRLTITRNEQTGCLAAEVISRVSGHPAVFMCTMGPGATNALTGLASAFADRAPLIWIVFQPEQEFQYPARHQYLPIAEICRPLCKEVHQPRSVAEIPAAVQRAVAVATADLAGPVAILIPIDVLQEVGTQAADVPDPWSDVADVRLAEPVPAAGGLTPIADQEQLQAVIDSSDAPLMVVGGGVVRGRLAKEVLGVAERGIPVMTSPAAKGVIPESHPFSAGCLSAYLDCVWRHPNLLAEVLAATDLIILAGFDEAEGITAEHLGEGRRILSLDGPSSLTGHVPIDWLCDLPLSESLRELAASRPRAQNRPGAVVADARTAAGRLGRIEGQVFDPVAAVTAISAGLPSDAWFCVDVGLHKHISAVAARIETPYRYVGSNGLASMGFGLPAAIGLARSHPQDRVIALCGDGGFLASANELETAARYGLDVTVFVLQDGEFGLIRRYHAAGPLSGTPADSQLSFSLTPIADLARSYGCAGVTLTSIAEVQGLLDLRRRGPQVIAVPVSYDDYISGRAANRSAASPLDQPILSREVRP